MDAKSRPWQSADVATKRNKLTPEKALAVETLEKSALSYLNRFDSSAVNLRKVLQRHIRKHSRGADRELIQSANKSVETIIDRYRQSGLIDDRRYASTMASSLRERGSSSRAIAHKLAARGVDAGDIQEAVQEVDRDCDGEAELVAARRLARRRRLGPHRPADERSERRDRDLGALARAGFSFDVARRALDEDVE